MHLRFLMVQLALWGTSIISLNAQNPTYGGDDPCANRQTRVDGQILYLTQGERVVYFKFVPSKFEYGVANGIWCLVETESQDTVYVWGNETPLVLDSQLNALGILKHDSLLYGPNAELRKHTENDYLVYYPKSTQFKGILRFWVDFDSIEAGGRCNGTGYYLKDFKPMGKPFTNPYILSRDSFNRYKEFIKKSSLHCDQDIRQFGVFLDDVSGDQLKIEHVYHSTALKARMFYLRKGSKKWVEISPKEDLNPYSQHRISPFVANDPQGKVFRKTEPRQFIFMNDGNWISPGASSNQMYYPNRRLPKGVKLIPAIPFRSFKRIR